MSALNQKTTRTKKERIKELLQRGTDTVYPTRKALEEKLLSSQRLRVYLGIDPSSPDLHIGNMVPLLKLRQFQELGHEVTLLVGDFTGQTGDPTDKQAARVPLSKAQVLANAKQYRRQASAVLSFTGSNPARLRYNSSWLEKMNFADVANLAGHFTVQQMIERDMFQDRLKHDKPISLREFLYPLMQGYDSVAMKVDVEIGATDQTFNMLAGRKLAREYLERDKFVLTVPILADAQGRKIGKSEGNAIKVTGEPKQLFGQLMALSDDVIVPALEWATRVPQTEVSRAARLVKTDPMEAKMLMAYEVLRQYQGTKSANQGRQYFTKVFRKRELPKNVPTWSSPRPSMPLWSLLKSHPTVPSSSEAHRLISQGAIKVDGRVVTDPNHLVISSDQPVIHIGKRTIIRIVR